MDAETKWNEGDEKKFSSTPVSIKSGEQNKNIPYMLNSVR